MKIHPNQSGAGHLLAVLALVVVVAVAAVGYRVQSTTDTETADNPVLQSQAKADVPDKIQSKADVKKADQALNSTNVDSGLSPGQLDGDIDALL